jgi:hypothetical protein
MNSLGGLLELLRTRRSRRFVLGMEMKGGPLAFKSRYQPVPLSEEEEAALVFSAAGITGHALADLNFEPGQGANIMGGMTGRVIPSGDAAQTVSLFVTNDSATYWIKRPQEMSREDIDAAAQLGRAESLAPFYKKMRVKIRDGRCAPSREPLRNIRVNDWSVPAAGTTFLIPVNDLTFIYINGLLEILNDQAGAFILDDRAGFKPAGLGRFARSKGGHLFDNPMDGRVATVSVVERLVTEFVTVEQGMILQNLALMAEALGLGGFPNFANHDFAWFEALGFRMDRMPASRYLGAGPVVSLAMRLMGRDPQVPCPIGLEMCGKPLLKAYSPPYFSDMEAAVRAVVAAKFGSGGVFRSLNQNYSWNENVPARVSEIGEKAIAATIAYCDYIWRRYGRFPALMPPFRTVVGFQCGHPDLEFYDRQYRPGVYTERHREAFERVKSRSNQESVFGRQVSSNQ